MDVRARDATKRTTIFNTTPSSTTAGSCPVSRWLPKCTMCWRDATSVWNESRQQRKHTDSICASPNRIFVFSKKGNCFVYFGVTCARFCVRSCVCKYECEPGMAGRQAGRERLYFVSCDDDSLYLCQCALYTSWWQTRFILVWNARVCHIFARTHTPSKKKGN